MTTISVDPQMDLDPALLEAEFADVLQMTRDVFGGDARIDAYPDPEIVGLDLINFCAVTRADSKSLLKMRLEWHRRLEELRPVYDRRLGLCLEPIEV